MEKIITIVKIILSIPKTIYFNFRVFNIKTALKFPVIISNNVKVKKIKKGSIIIKSPKIKLGMIKIGISGSNAINSQKGIVWINKSSSVEFKGTASFAEGIILYNNTGKTIFGDNFIANKNCFISCDSVIEFGNNVLLGWNVNIRDSNGHSLIEKGIEKENVKKVQIGDHVWICSHVDILKGTIIGSNCVIAYRSCLTGIITKDNQLIGGYPAKILKNNINWKK